MFKIHATSILPSTPTSCKWPLYCSFPYQYPRVFLLFPIRATCLPHHLSYIWRAEHNLNLRIKQCPASLPSFTALSSRNVFLGCLFSNIQPIFFPSSERRSVTHHCVKLCLCVVCCTDTDPNNRYANRETPLNKRTRYDSDQVKLAFMHFPDHFCRISLHQGRYLLRPAAFSATTSPTFEVTYVQCMVCACIYIWSLMIQAFQDVKLYLSVTAVTPSDTTYLRRAVI